MGKGAGAHNFLKCGFGIEVRVAKSLEGEFVSLGSFLVKFPLKSEFL